MRIRRMDDDDFDAVVRVWHTSVSPRMGLSSYGSN